jgi:hypothetical protein
VRLFKKKKEPPSHQKWKEPYLIQRLTESCAKEEGLLSQLAESLSFGGGRLRGGFSEEAWNVVRQIFSFDYMGSAEFEWGAVPQSFSNIARNRKEYISFSKIFKGSKYQTYEVPVGKKRRKIIDMPAREVTIYVLCHSDIKEQIDSYLEKLRQGDYGNSGVSLKEGTRFRACLFPEEEYSWVSRLKRKEDPKWCMSVYERIKGWVDIENNFMFFRDKEMYEATKALFEIK